MIYSISGLFIMLEIGISAVASLFSVFVMHLHSNWMKGNPVPHWLLQLTCLARTRNKTIKLNDSSARTIKQVSQ